MEEKIKEKNNKKNKKGKSDGAKRMLQAQAQVSCPHDMTWQASCPCVLALAPGAPQGCPFPSTSIQSLQANLAKNKDLKAKIEKQAMAKVRPQQHRTTTGAVTSFCFTTCSEAPQRFARQIQKAEDKESEGVKEKKKVRCRPALKTK